jgi:hypothetical protein
LTYQRQDGFLNKKGSAVMRCFTFLTPLLCGVLTLGCSVYGMAGAQQWHGRGSSTDWDGTGVEHHQWSSHTAVSGSPGHTDIHTESSGTSFGAHVDPVGLASSLVGMLQHHHSGKQTSDAGDASSDASLPSGSYQATCSRCFVSHVNRHRTLSCECLDQNQAPHWSRIHLHAGRGCAIQNNDGRLTC